VSRGELVIPRPVSPSPTPHDAGARPRRVLPALAREGRIRTAAPHSRPRRTLAGVWHLCLLTIGSVKEFLAEHERHGAEQGADTIVQALVPRLEPLTVAGSGRVTLQRVV
jgi:hypothetical protein